jgi:3-hydroxyisobutyrate dehydrogenase-like beta-hydroxyacid dehydrogenase
MTSDQTNVGYVGLGAMGGAMAKNVARAGYPLTVFDVDDKRVNALVQEGATSGASPAEVARQTEVVFTSLPGAPQVLDVYLGQQGLAEGAHPGLTAVDMSTVPPEISRRVSAGLVEAGAEFLDGPVARTKEAAIAGTLSIMVGGSEEGFARILPILEVMGSTVVRVGDVGAGQVAKLLNNAILMSNIVTASEALVVGVRAGVDAAKLVEVISEGSGDSFALRNHVAKSVVPGEFAENRFPLDYALKDLGYFFELCRDTGSVCLQMSIAQELYQAARNQGYRAEYFPIVSRVIELLGGGHIGPSS